VKDHNHELLWDGEWDTKAAIFLGWGCGGITQCIECKKYLHVVYRISEESSNKEDEVIITELPERLLALYLLYKAP
jgi:hypothetical protein